MKDIQLQVLVFLHLFINISTIIITASASIKQLYFVYKL